MTSIQGENVPNANVVVSWAGQREVIDIGGVKHEVLEDGTTTDRRIGAVNVYVPPHTTGPMQHWHQLHDETFLILSGEITFTSREEQVVLKAGDYIVVPPMAPHTFANNTDQEAVMYNTFTPAYYVDFFRVLEKMIKGNGGQMTPEIVTEAMLRYATLPTKRMGYDFGK